MPAFLAKFKVPVLDTGRIIRLAQHLEQGLGRGDGTVAATGTAHGDGDPVAAFRFHLRQHEAHQVKKLLLEFLRGLGGKDIVTDSLVLAAEGTQFFYQIGIGQKAQVKDEIRLARDAVLEAERDDVDPGHGWKNGWYL